MADRESIRGRNTKERVNGLLDDYERLTKQLFESFSSPYQGTRQDVSTGDSTQVLEKLTSKDKELQAAVAQAKEQQKRQQDIESLKLHIAKKDEKILALEVQLKEAEQILSQALFQAKKKLTAIEKANKGSVSSEELIKYAHQISSSNAVEAPTTWMAGDPRRPYPLDIEMRSGLLGRLGEGVAMETEIPTSTVGVAETSAVTAPVNGVVDGVANGPSASSLSWQSSLHAIGIPSTTEQTSIGNDVTMGAANGRNELTTEEVEFMSSSSCSSSSDSP
ncbi:mediator of RNA polymerase II transcription subunit 4 isoform X1 [Nematostella vectensis]|uniref:mediator of RNA polymerase II transcription subunit 4 isoform X1 n=1 Tax=Nematostella vectensis TaxID=45351 RepID=UPI00207799F2|nr:mediator of RNA polymerase II transcription subunit 4 isoform X1 [Nematostella vectensis]